MPSKPDRATTCPTKGNATSEDSASIINHRLIASTRSSPETFCSRQLRMLGYMTGNSATTTGTSGRGALLQRQVEWQSYILSPYYGEAQYGDSLLNLPLAQIGEQVLPGSISAPWLRTLLLQAKQPPKTPCEVRKRLEAGAARPLRHVHYERVKPLPP
jgi:hypothetical protein